jgi:hypothetical protein
MENPLRGSYRDYSAQIIEQFVVRMKQSSLYRIFLVASIISLLASDIGVWIRLIRDPAERTGSDFIALYSVGRIAQDKGYSQVYDPLKQQEVEEKVVGFPLGKDQVLLYNHLPFLLPILRSIVSEDYVSSFYRWIFLLIAIYITAAGVLSKLLQEAKVDQQTIYLTGVGSLLFLPLFFSLMNGQDTAFLFLGTSLWMFGLLTKKDKIAGLGLSLTTVRPHISLILAIPMLFHNRRIFLWYAVGSGILAVLSFLLIGMEGVQDFLDILRISAAGEWHGMKEEAMFNLIGLLTRILPGVNQAALRTCSWILYGLAILWLSYIWAKNKDGRSILGMTVVVALFTVPHLHFHDLTLLLIPLYEFIFLKLLRPTAATVLPSAVSLLLLVSNAAPVLQYTTPYLVMLAAVLFPWYLQRRRTLISPHRSQLPEK